MCYTCSSRNDSPSISRMRYLGGQDGKISSASLTPFEFPWVVHLISLPISESTYKKTRYEWIHGEYCSVVHCVLSLLPLSLLWELCYVHQSGGPSPPPLPNTEHRVGQISPVTGVGVFLPLTLTWFLSTVTDLILTLEDFKSPVTLFSREGNWRGWKLLCFLQCLWKHEGLLRLTAPWVFWLTFSDVSLKLAEK